MPRKRHSNPNSTVRNRKADPDRNVKRKVARVVYLMRLMKEKEIGPDPLFDHSRGRFYEDRLEKHKDWKRRSDEYDKMMTE